MDRKPSNSKFSPTASVDIPVPAGASGNEIVKVHSPLTARMFPPKFDQNFNQHTPVLHRITPEQVEIVYHRRSGTDEVVRSRNIQKRKKKINANGTVAIESTISVTTENHSKTREEGLPKTNAIIINEYVESKDLPREALQDEEDGCSKCRTPVEKNVPECVEVCSTSRESAGNESAKVPEEVTARLSEFALVVTKMADVITNLENRIRQMEQASRVMAAEQIVLKKLLVKHLRGNALVAEDMKNLHNSISTGKSAVLGERVEKVLELAKTYRSNENNTCEILGRPNGDSAQKSYEEIPNPSDDEKRK